MTRSLVEIWEPDGSDRLGDGPLEPLAYSITRLLDGPASVVCDLLATDDRTLDLIRSKRQLRVRTWDSDSSPPRESRAVIEEIGIKDSADGYILTADGIDLLGSLKWTNVLLGYKIDGDSVNTAIDDLLTLAGASFTRSGSVTTTISARLDGASVLKSLQTIARQQGIHFRLSATPGVIDIGALGSSNGLRIVNATQGRAELHDNNEILLLEDFTQLTSSEEMCNWLLPLGAGDGDAQLTLAASTRSSPYTIQSVTGPDGRDLFFIEDSASQTAHGVTIMKTGKFSEITAIANSAAAVEAAANALYDISAAWLQRYKDPYESYSVTVRKPRTNILPGDKIHVRYKGVIETESGTLTYRSINTDMWIIEVAEAYGPRGTQVRLKIANIDRYEVDNASVVLGAMEELRVNNVSTKSYFSHYVLKDAFEIDSTHPVNFDLVITNAVQTITRVVLRIVTTPFTATASGAASGGGSTSGSGGGQTSSAGGDHRHRIAVFLGSALPGVTNRAFIVGGPSASTNMNIPTLTSGGDQDLYTFDSSGTHSHTVANHTHSVPAHTHALDYSLQKDTDYPDHVSVEVNGTSVATDLDTSGVGLDTEIDITDEINAAATLQQAHTIEITCTGGQGRVACWLDVYEVIQSIGVFS